MLTSSIKSSILSVCQPHAQSPREALGWVVLPLRQKVAQKSSAVASLYRFPFWTEETPTSVGSALALKSMRT